MPIRMHCKGGYRWAAFGVARLTTPLSQALETENAKLRYQVLHLKRAVVEADAK